MAGGGLRAPGGGGEGGGWVLASNDSPSGSSIKGLGCPSRETGHSRVPAPPERITGTSINLLLGYALKIGIHHRLDQGCEAGFRRPAQHPLGLARIPQ